MDPSLGLKLKEDGKKRMYGRPTKNINRDEREKKQNQKVHDLENKKSGGNYLKNQSSKNLRKRDVNELKESNIF